METRQVEKEPGTPTWYCPAPLLAAPLGCAFRATKEHGLGRGFVRQGGNIICTVSAV
jgi:hypothetical protein